MEIFVDALIVIGMVVGGLTAIVVGCVLVEVVGMVASAAWRRVRLLVRYPVALFRAARARSASPWLACKLTLLIGFDEQRGRFHPSVQLHGTGVLKRPLIRLELVDEDGVTRLVRTRRLPPDALGSELELPAFELLDGVSAQNVLSWRWDVVVEDGGWPLAHWHEHPRPVGRLNAEAELA